MATNVPKSYQATIKHPTPPSGPASPTSPSGPASLKFPHTYTNNMFQVPAGKTWQVLKMYLRIPPPADQVSFFRIEKTSSGGVEQMVLQHNVTEENNIALYADELGRELSQFRDLVLEDQEIIRQLVKVSGPQIKFTMQYEISVMEFTP